MGKEVQELYFKGTESVFNAIKTGNSANVGKEGLIQVSAVYSIPNRQDHSKNFTPYDKH